MKFNERYRKVDNMKIWNTKYCLTDGITEHDIKYTGSRLVVVPKTEKRGSMSLWEEGKDWHKSLDAAMLRAQEVKLKKLESLAKSIKKISLLSFEAKA